MNVTTLNMATLDGDIIIKRGEGGGSTPPSGGDGWVYYKFDGEAAENTDGFDIFVFYQELRGLLQGYYISTAYDAADGVEEKMLYMFLNTDENPSRFLGFKTQTSENLLKSLGVAVSSVMAIKELIDYSNEMSGGQMPPSLVAFANALTPCTKEEFEALITN